MNFEKESFFSTKKIPCGHDSISCLLNSAFKQFSSLSFDVNTSFTKKVDELCNLWQRLLMFVCEGLKGLNEFIGLICHWTLHIILSDEWVVLKSATKNYLLTSIKLCKLQLHRSGLGDFVHTFDNIVKVHATPWAIPFLDKIFNEVQVNRDEIVTYYIEEHDFVFERIKILCLSQCKDLALKLVDSCLVVANNKQAELLEELHFILLHILNRTNQVLTELNLLSIQKSMNLVNNFILYLNLTHVSDETTSLYNGLESLLKQLLDILMKKVALQKDANYFNTVCTLWMDHVVKKINDQSKFKSILSSFADLLVSPSHLYYLCRILNNHFVHTNRIFCIEMFQRALTRNINEFENMKEREDKKKSAENLSQGFLELSALVADSEVIVRECLLTSFSLFPSKELFLRIQKELNALQIKSESNYNRSLWTDGATIGLSQEHCDDLVILLEVHRHSSLSWNLDQKDLLHNCEAHMTDYESIFEKRPLNHLHIDYSQFDNIPRPKIRAYDGIEKGYEKFLEDFPLQNVKDVVEELRFLKKEISQVEKVQTNNDNPVVDNSPVKDKLVIQKPLIPKENTLETMQGKNKKSQLRRKSQRKKSCKENKVDWVVKSPVNHTSKGLKLVLYPKKKINRRNTVETSGNAYHENYECSNKSFPSKPIHTMAYDESLTLVNGSTTTNQNKLLPPSQEEDIIIVDDDNASHFECKPILESGLMSKKHQFCELFSKSNPNEALSKRQSEEFLVLNQCICNPTKELQEENIITVDVDDANASHIECKTVFENHVKSRKSLVSTASSKIPDEFTDWIDLSLVESVSRLVKSSKDSRKLSCSTQHEPHPFGNSPDFNEENYLNEHNYSNTKPVSLPLPTNTNSYSFFSCKNLNEKSTNVENINSNQTEVLPTTSDRCFNEIDKAFTTKLEDQEKFDVYDTGSSKFVDVRLLLNFRTNEMT